MTVGNLRSRVVWEFEFTCNSFRRYCNTVIEAVYLNNAFCGSFTAGILFSSLIWNLHLMLDWVSDCTSWFHEGWIHFFIAWLLSYGRPTNVIAIQNYPRITLSRWKLHDLAKAWLRFFTITLCRSSELSSVSVGSWTSARQISINCTVMLTVTPHVDDVIQVGAQMWSFLLIMASIKCKSVFTGLINNFLAV